MNSESKAIRLLLRRAVSGAVSPHERIFAAAAVVDYLRQGLTAETACKSWNLTAAEKAILISTAEDRLAAEEEALFATKHGWEVLLSNQANRNECHATAPDFNVMQKPPNFTVIAGPIAQIKQLLDALRQTTV